MIKTLTSKHEKCRAAVEMLLTWRKTKSEFEALKSELVIRKSLPQVN